MKQLKVAAGSLFFKLERTLQEVESNHVSCFVYLGGLTQLHLPIPSDLAEEIWYESYLLGS